MVLLTIQILVYKSSFSPLVSLWPHLCLGFTEVIERNDSGSFPSRWRNQIVMFYMWKIAFRYNRKQNVSESVYCW